MFEFTDNILGVAVGGLGGHVSRVGRSAVCVYEVPVDGLRGFGIVSRRNLQWWRFGELAALLRGLREWLRGRLRGEGMVGARPFRDRGLYRWRCF